MSFLMVYLLTLCFQPQTSNTVKQEVIIIEVVDPTIAEKQEQEEIRNQGKIKRIATDFKEIKKDWQALKGMLSRDFQPGRLTGEPLSAKKHAKSARALLKNGDTYGAACALLDAMDIKPRKNYVKSLAGIAEKAYRTKLAMAEESGNVGSMDVSLEHYQHLSRYTRSLTEHGMATFPLIDVDTAIYEAKLANAKRTYREGLALMESEQWDEAIEAFQSSIGFMDPFQDNRQQLAHCLLQKGNLLLDEQAYSAAADIFLKALKVDGGNEDVRARAGEVSYQLGEYYFQNQRYRTAQKQWEKLLAVDNGYRDIIERVEEAREKATRTVTIAPFPEKSNEANHDSRGVVYFQEALLQFLRENRSPYFIIDESNDHPEITLEANNIVTIQTGEPLVKEMRAIEDILGTVHESVTEVTTVTLDYVDFQLRHQLTVVADFVVRGNAEGWEQKYEIDQSWNRNHRWTYIKDRKETKDFAPNDSAGLFAAGQLIREITGLKTEKLTVQEVEKLSKASNGMTDLKEMTTELAHALGRDLLARFDAEEPLAPPEQLKLAFGP